MVTDVRENLVATGKLYQLDKRQGRDGKVRDSSKIREANKARAQKKETSTTVTTSDGDIAEHCGVSQMTVTNIREELVSVKKIIQVNKRMGRDGKVRDSSKIREANKARAQKKETKTTVTTVVLNSSHRHQR